MNKFSVLRIVVLLLLLNAVRVPPDLVPVYQVDWIPHDAIALPYVILTKYNSEEIIAHERCHIQQMNQYGPVVMLVINVYYDYRYGYEHNPFEVQAYNDCK